jgi:small subunit ribosomal protein S16
MLKIRMQRFGKKKAPIYRIVVIEKAQRRQGKPTEVLGFYNPISKLLVYNTERALYWKGIGAQPSETCAYILAKEPTHDLKNGHYEFKEMPRSEKEKIKAEVLSLSTKNTKAKKKHAAAAAKPKEAAPAATEEAPAA